MPQHRLIRVSREAAWVALGQLLAFLGGFALIKVLTGQLGPAAYGQLALGISAAGALHMFLYGPLEQAALRYVSVYREREQIGLLLRVMRKSHLAAAALVLTAASAAVAASLVFAPQWLGLIVWASMLGLAGGINATLLSLQTALRQRPAAALFQAGDVWLRLGLASAGLLLAGNTADIALFGFCLAAVATAIVQLLWLSRDPTIRSHQAGSAAWSHEEEKRASSELLAYGMPYIAFAGFAWLSAYADRWMLLLFAGQAEVGVYAALFQIANAPIALFLGATNQFLVPVIFDRAGAASRPEQAQAGARVLHAAVSVYVVALAAIVAAAALLANPLVEFLTNAEFAQHAELLWILCLGISLSSTGQLLVVKGLARNRSQDYILPKFVQVVLLLASAALLVAPLGLPGMALAVCVSGAGYLVAVMMANRRLERPSS